MPKNTTGLTLQAMRRKTKLSFGGRGAYAVESLESGQFSEHEIRKEYSRLRDIMRKRTQRLEASEEWRHISRESTPASLNYENYPSLRELKSQRDVIEKLRDLAQAIESPLSTITGLQQVRARSLESLHETYPETAEFVTEETYREFGEFMELVRTTVGNRKYYNDEEVLALFGEHVRTGSSKADLEAAFKAYQAGISGQVNNIPEVKR